MSIVIKRATVDEVALIAPLFNSYRMFYRQHSNLDAAIDFLHQRLEADESIIFMALDDDKAVGFTQLYPIFSSVGLKNALLLNDLFVAETARGKGVANTLLNAAKEYGKEKGCGWLMLQTAITNAAARKLYEANGWKLDDEYLVYNYSLGE